MDILVFQFATVDCIIHQLCGARSRGQYQNTARVYPRKLQAIVQRLYIAVFGPQLRSVSLYWYFLALYPDWLGGYLLVRHPRLSISLFHLKAKTGLEGCIDDPGYHSVLDKFPGSHLCS